MPTAATDPAARLTRKGKENVAPEEMHPRFKTIIPILLSEGELLDEITTLPGFPTRSQIYAAEQADPKFAAAMLQATDNCARTLLSESQALAREAAAEGDKDKAVIAEKLAKATLGFAEKSAPKKYGNLLKLADKDGEAFQVHVINYSNGGQASAVNGGALHPVIDAVATAVEAKRICEDAEYVSSDDDNDTT